MKLHTQAPAGRLRRCAALLTLAAVVAIAGCAGARTQAQPARDAASPTSVATPTRSAPLRAARARLRDELRLLEGTAAWSIEVVPEGVLLVLPARASFAADRAELLAPAAATLGKVALSVARQPRLGLRVTGHTDSVGRAAFNEEFSRQRALAVAAALSAAGIAAERIETRGAGEREPSAAETDSAGREANRRVEILIVDAPR
jgi:outer membrane protein OmpA-like peptidoglycan-associated protein